MRPVLFHIGSFPLRSYGLMVAAAFVFGLLLARRRARAQGLDPDMIIDMVFFVMLTSIAGARLTYVVAHWGYYVNDIARAFKVWDGGLTLYGGVTTGVVVGFLFFKRRGVDPWLGVDVAAPALALGIGIGRIGCFLNGCCFGRECDLPWAVTFAAGSGAANVFPGIAIHPTQIYESLAAFAVMAVLLIVDRKKPFDGFLLTLLLILLAVYRLFVDPLRYYASISMVIENGALSVTRNQLFGLVVILVSSGFMVYLSKRSAARTRA
jgi:phosphatidylglycerol:prolipoprotein diacylglycerol transferase